MNIIIKSKWVCIESSYRSAFGKVYEVTTDTNTDEVANVSISISYYIGDNGRPYIIDFEKDKQFITLEEWRQQQLDKLL
jgi:hypothetical protein